MPKCFSELRLNYGNQCLAFPFNSEGLFRPGTLYKETYWKTGALLVENVLPYIGSETRSKASQAGGVTLTAYLASGGSDERKIPLTSLEGSPWLLGSGESILGRWALSKWEKSIPQRKRINPIQNCSTNTSFQTTYVWYKKELWEDTLSYVHISDLFKR